MPYVVNTLSRFFSKICLGAAISTMLSWPGPAAAQMVLNSGQTHVIAPPQTQCVTITSVEPDSAGLPIAEAQCDGATGTADVNADTNLAQLSVRVESSSIFQFWFTVADAGGTVPPSLIPVHVRVPNDWAFRLFNSHGTELGGNASANILLQLRQDPELDPEGRGELIERTTILAATHGGLAGCLSIPGDATGVAVLAIRCALAVNQRLRGNSNSSLNAIVEVGRIYNIELEITARARSEFLGGIALKARASTAVILPTAPGLQWSEMVVTIGTDPAALVADLQDQIDRLRRDLTTHTHNYLTGRGQGHNNTLAVSSPAIIPGGTAAGLTTSQLQAGAAAGPQKKK